MERKWIFVSVAVIVAAVGVGLFAATPRKRSIMMSGSTSVAPVAEELALAYMGKNPNVKITVGGGGSTVGILQAYERVVDIGMSSRKLKQEELGWGLHVTTIAMDGIVVIIHPKNPVKDLTIEQLRKIYTGEITNWKEVGGADAGIRVKTREEGSGTRSAFEELVMKGKDISPHAITHPSTGAMKAAVARDELAIGYISFAALDETIKALSIGGVPPTVEEMKPGGKYPIVRPFLFVTAEEPTEMVKDFIDFVLSEKGQQIVKAAGCIPVG